MSEASKFVAESLEELLASIADGVREAQSTLNDAPSFDAFGRPVPSYHLPYIDFDLKIDLETTQTSGGTRLLRIMPFGGSNTKNTSKEISSSISGKLIAIPPGEGLPVPVLQMSSKRIRKHQHTIDLVAQNSAGEVIQNTQIEINLNLELSKQLSQAQNITLNSLKKTQLARALLLTDDLGQASTELTIDSSIDENTNIVVTAELDQRTANIVFKAEKL